MLVLLFVVVVDALVVAAPGRDFLLGKGAPYQGALPLSRYGGTSL
jgi:hypothetical protein